MPFVFSERVSWEATPIVATMEAVNRRTMTVNALNVVLDMLTKHCLFLRVLLLSLT